LQHPNRAPTSANIRHWSLDHVDAKSTRLRYGAAAQVFRWLTVALVATAYLVNPGRSEQRVYSAAADFTRHIHETVGMLIFAIVLVRILWRTIDTSPGAPPMELWMKYSAKLAHLALYALLITLPLHSPASAKTRPYRMAANRGSGSRSTRPDHSPSSRDSGRDGRLCERSRKAKPPTTSLDSWRMDVGRNR
jgi:hypothetical protein